MRIIKSYWIIVILILIVVSTRLLVFNINASDFISDEWRYRILISKLDEAVAKDNYLIPFQTIFRLDARPGSGLFYYPAAFLEWKYPSIPFGAYYNLAVNTLIIMLTYLIIKKTHGKKAAILATLLVTLSTASVIYMRHLLAYDIALFLLLLGFYIYVYLHKSFAFGLLVGFSFLTYPSYYYYLLPIPIVLFFYHRSIKPVLLFITGVGVILIFTNVFSIAIGETTSYFQSLKNESKNVTAYHYGDNVAALSFISQYIFTIDGIWSLFLIVLAFLIMVFKRHEKKITIIGVYLILAFLVMEIYSHMLKTHVLYGRTVRPFYLILLVFIAVTLDRLFNMVSKRNEQSYSSNKMIYILCFSIIMFITFLNGLPRFINFKNLLYPAQFKQQSREYLKARYSEFIVEEALFVNYFGINSPPKMKIFTEYKDGEPGKFYIINANIIYPYFGSYNLNLFCKSYDLLKELHVQYKFRPYLFEGWNEIMREQSAKDPLYYQLIYCKP